MAALPCQRQRYLDCGLTGHDRSAMYTIHGSPELIENCGQWSSTEIYFCMIIQGAGQSGAFTFVSRVDSFGRAVYHLYCKLLHGFARRALRF